jgi:hypothetical protein
MIKRVSVLSSFVSCASVRHITGAATPDISSFSQNWNMMSQSQAQAMDLAEREEKSNAKDKIPDYTRKPQERIPAAGKYHTVDPTIKQDHDAKIREEEVRWKQSMRGQGGVPVPNPENSLGYGMRRRIKIVDDDDLKDPRSLGDAFEIGNLAMRK